MKVKEYFKKYNVNGDVTFIIAKAEKDSNTPFYHSVYETTPMQHVSRWCESDVAEYIVLNDHQTPIDWLSGAKWKTQYDSGWLKCMLVIAKDDLVTMYSEKQAEGIAQFCETKFTA